MPGTKIGDGTKVGAGSVVSGNLPPRCMAAGFPARIVGRAPVFPKKITDEEKVKLFRKITTEMIQYFIGSGLACRQDGERYLIQRSRSRGFWSQTSWRMYVTDGDVREMIKGLSREKIDVFLSLWEVPADVRELLTANRIMWIDVAKKEQSRVSNDLGEEVLGFLRRYGVRTLRYPQTQMPQPVAEPCEINC